MSFIELAKRRYSVRNYREVPVEEDKIMAILEAGRMAPSAVNYQPLRFIVATEEDAKGKISKAYPRPWFQKAPVIIVVCGDHSQSWKRGSDQKDHCDIDAAIATDHMALAAADLGLGSCWVCAFDAKKCHETLGLPNYLEVIALLPIGYPEGEAPVKSRKEFKSMISFNGYKDK